MAQRRLLGRLAVASVITLILLLSIASYQTTPRVEAADDNRLSITLAPPRVPADNNTYDVVIVELQNRSGFPTPASEDVRVILTSSKIEVGLVEQFITINEGSTFAIAKFSSTITPGQTNITAISTGYIPASKIMVTVEPSGTPTILSVALGPSKIAPQAGGTGTVTVQLLDATGMPARAEVDIRVTMSSSSTRVGTVDPSLIISAESTFGIARFHTGFAVGETTIAASSSGYSTGSAILNVVGPLPAKLVVNASPRIIPRLGYASVVTAQLEDFQGIPARAPVDIPVTVTSSVSGSVSVRQELITIRSGESYASTSVASGSIGSSNVTASAQGYEPSKVNVEVISGTSRSAGRIGVHLAPGKIPPATESQVIVQLQDLNSPHLPIIAEREIEVFVASSNTTIGTVDAVVKIPSGSSHGFVKFKSSLLSGTTLVTAHATNFDKGNATMSVVEAIPYKIALSSIPRLIPADGQRYDSIIVELQDVNGRPAKAPSDIVVFLSSSRTDVGIVSETVTLNALSSYAAASFRTTLVAGVTNITASALGYVAAPPLRVTTVKPAPSQIAVYASPATIPASQGRYETIAVQLQDVEGVPAKAKFDTTIFLSSTDPRVGTVSQTVTIPAGRTFARASFNATNNPGTTTITATASGFSRGSAMIRTALTQLSVITTLQADKLTVSTGEIVSLRVSVTESSVGVSNASLSWSTSLGSISNPSRFTDANGQGSGIFFANSPGPASVMVSAGKPGYKPVSTSILINVTSVTVPTDGSNGQPPPTTGGFDQLIFIAPVAVVAALGFLLFRRRRRIKPTKKEKEGTAEEEYV
ncbi:MAG: hypothetical protein HY619_04555 [Thaumarchaeota archaeon]|nr:hypothetical protein [Nitrososphaerota archaeon]